MRREREARQLAGVLNRINRHALPASGALILGALAAGPAAGMSWLFAVFMIAAALVAGPLW